MKNTIRLLLLNLNKVNIWFFSLLGIKIHFAKDKFKKLIIYHTCYPKHTCHSEHSEKSRLADVLIERDPSLCSGWQKKTEGQNFAEWQNPKINCHSEWNEESQSVNAFLKRNS